MSMLERLARYNQGTRSRRDIPKLNIKPKPGGINDDGQDRSFISRQREIVNQILSPTVKHFGFDGASTLPFSRKSSPPRARTTDSPESSESDFDYDRVALLDLSDSVRASLQHDKTIGPDYDKLSEFLEAALRDEELRHPGLDFETVEYARLDKLLAELLHHAGSLRIGSGPTSGGLGAAMALVTPIRSTHETHNPHIGTWTSRNSHVGAGRKRAGSVELPPRYRADLAAAKNLLRAWRRRFREQYFMMDQHRCAVLVKGGRLKDVSFDSSLTYDLGKWHTKVSDPISELESNLGFETGHWWLNITCAERDGIVASSFEIPTKGRYGITTLPLMTGQEEMMRPNTYKYVREGRAPDMHIALISQVGRQIRVLRGYRLKSILAPQAGVRYDGLFTIKQYGFRQDSKTGAYRLELTLERMPDQKKSLEEIRKIPRPSQLDDWNLYEKLEGDKIKLLQGETTYLEWKLRRQEENIEREDWRRARLFKASFSH
ncbi:PUA-like domain-containing protein [Annulohypoxylon truncatum]|uniref:PUA-like domain-containing protein n=1 Tax=Annulohypoxylon truncatum TaxID=327061 RepID=UPI002008AAF0|nr:PUA-like domain-containing protein [Annulohypoxylon truncatum]KAI1212932.1 PUA-like domain-containing protein [Annulohypoxylon truncatum]